MELIEKQMKIKFLKTKSTKIKIPQKYKISLKDNILEDQKFEKFIYLILCNLNKLKYHLECGRKMAMELEL